MSQTDGIVGDCAAKSSAYDLMGRHIVSTSEQTELRASAQRVQDALNAHGVDCQVVELAASTRTAQEAAEAVGCEVAQIVKSLIFRGKQSGKAILVVASGANRVDEQTLRDLLGEKVSKPDADFVREQTGFVIGGVPPAWSRAAAGDVHRRRPAAARRNLGRGGHAPRRLSFVARRFAVGDGRSGGGDQAVNRQGWPRFSFERTQRLGAFLVVLHSE